MSVQLQGIKRKIIYVGIYEAIAFALATLGFIGASDAPVATASALSAFAAIFALVWNFACNALFERWEAGPITRGRSGRRRLAHAIGFELGFLIVLMPVAAWWLDISYLRSFVVNLGMNIFFFFYTMGFTWAFDRVFGLPESARARE